MSADWQSRLDDAFETAVSKGVFSGASLLVSRHRKPAFERTWGRVETRGAPVTPAVRFDLASLTKPLVTAPLCMAAIEGGFFDLDDPISKFFPGCVPPDKTAITVKNLLSHASGLAPYAPFYLELVKLPPGARRREELASMILKSPLDNPPNKAACYSDLGFMLLGLILERQMGARLDRLAHDLLFAPLGIDELQFCPMENPAGGPTASPTPDTRYLTPDTPHPTPDTPHPTPDTPHPTPDTPHPTPDTRYAATQLCPWRKRLLSGEVDDENAWALDGVAGHAGLFGTARGVFELLSFLWGLYEGHTKTDFSPPSAAPAPLRTPITAEVVRTFWTRSQLGPAGSSEWCLGYDTPSRKGYSSAGRFFSQNSVGHLGFTGVSFWLDLEKRLLIILLTNRVHPTRKNDEIRHFRPALHDIVMKELLHGN